MQDQEKKQIIDSLFAIIDSEAYALRLARIHKHYPNLKSEGRYRDALLETFNDEQEKLESGLWAYAEADRVDMVVTKASEEDGTFRRLRIEFKYHFTYDMWHRVGSALQAFCAIGKKGDVEAVRGLSKGDLRSIAIDCLAPKGEDKCDLFILVVQDRHGASDPAITEPIAAGRKKQAVAKVHQRGVPIHFLNEQIKLDAWHRTDGNGVTYRDAWSGPLHAMLSHLHYHRRFRLIPGKAHVMPPRHVGVPLTSHIIGLDFSIKDADFPPEPADLFR